MGMDTPLRRTMRQYVGKVLLRGFIRRMDAIMVPGERAWQYARFLGADENRIYRGLYGVDYQSFHKSLLQRRETTWPHRFLFVGRYSQEKGLDRLIAAYHKYRSAVDDPWTLTCCGKGTLGGMLQGQIGITDVGFVPPDLQPDLFAQHGTLILPSRFDPWPLVIVEACASGMPIICTQACGSAVELVRPYYNGLMCATDSADALAGDMVWIHENGNRLSEMGTASCELAAPYSAESWAFRWINMLERMG
jgi:glycosyltransferase involved in cell wall biosynthesis